MGRSIGHADTFSAPNIFKNGGFETDDTDFWTANNYGVSISKAVVDQQHGCRSFASLLLSSDKPFSFIQSFSGEHVFVDYVENSDSDAPLYRLDMGYPGVNDNGLIPPTGDYSLYGGPVTLSFSIKVIGGKVNIYGMFNEKDKFSDHTSVDTVLTSSLELIAKNYQTIVWARPTATFTPTQFIHSAGIYIERVEGSPQVEFGNIQLVSGEYQYLPYTGCVFSRTLPKNATVFAMGSSCPPGFKQIYEGETFFIKDGAPSTVGGSEKHESHEITQYMRDDEDETNANNDDWYKRFIINDPNIVSSKILESDQIRADDGRLAHEHEITAPAINDNSVPIWRGVLLCRKK